MPKSMSARQVLKQLEAWGDDKVRQRYVRDGAGDNVFGVLMGRIRGLAQTLGTSHALGLELWESGNHEARILACMLLDPAALSEKQAPLVTRRREAVRAPQVELATNHS
ncbi:MAG: DNA alkylation repair protein [Myxococcales bacterium]